MKKCNGDRCPMQYMYDVDSCRLTDGCPYYGLKVYPTKPKEIKMTKEEYNKRLDVLREKLTPVEIWGQLAEEAAELSQACLKIQRLYMPTNKPRMDKSDCYDNLYEEIADVLLIMDILDVLNNPFCDDISEIMDHKLSRWFHYINKETDHEKTE